MAGVKATLVKLLMTTLHYMMALLARLAHPVFAMLYEKEKENVLPPVQNNLLMKPAVELAQLIRDKKVSCVDVIEAYIARVVEVNKDLNAVVVESFQQAVQTAHKYDEVLSRPSLPEEYSVERMPLLGVPFTAKESFAITGLRNTCGLLNWKDQVANTDADVVANLKQGGAIPLGLTNCSELCTWYESNNLVYGRTNNAYHRGRIVGGSSGGEGCILSAAGSVIGVGSDIGGSIRMPAYFNGVFGHKPSKGVVSNAGQLPGTGGEVMDYLTTGPMCRYADDIIPMYKVMAGPAGLEKVTLDAKVNVKNLKYFYLEDDGGRYFTSPVDPQIKEAINKVVEYFRDEGSSVERAISLQKSLMWSMNIYSSMFFTAEGGKSMCDLMGSGSGQAANPFWEMARWFAMCPRHTVPAALLGMTEKIPHPAKMVAEMREMYEGLKKDLSEMLGKDGVFIYPTHPVPAPYHNQTVTLNGLTNLAYTAIFNVLGLPVTQVPMGLSKEGVPIGFQVVANFNQDHLSIAVAKELERQFGGWVPPFQYSQ